MSRPKTKSAPEFSPPRRPPVIDELAAQAFIKEGPDALDAARQVRPVKLAPSLEEEKPASREDAEARTRVTVYLPAGLAKKLKVEAVMRETTLSALATEALGVHLAG